MSIILCGSGPEIDEASWLIQASRTEEELRAARQWFQAMEDMVKVRFWFGKELEMPELPPVLEGLRREYGRM